MRAMALWLALASNGVAHAAVFALEPMTARANEEVRLRVDDPVSGCTLFSVPAVVREGDAVTVRFELDDGVPPGPCLPERVTPRLHSLGSFAPGNYTVQVRICVNAPGGLTCPVHTTRGLTVFGTTGTRTAIPTLSIAAIALLAMLVAMVPAIKRD